MLLDRLEAASTSVLPDATVIVTGSLALGDYQPGKSDVDLLVLSDAPTDGLVEAVEHAWSQEPGEFYTSCGMEPGARRVLHVVRYAVAARPRRRPHLALGISDYGDRFEVERDTEEADLVVEFSVCRQLGRSDVIGPVPDEWVDEVGAAVMTRWKTIGDDAPDRELMALTACRISRFREERVHCSKPAAAQWARERGAHVACDDASVRTLLDRASG